MESARHGNAVRIDTSTVDTDVALAVVDGARRTSPLEREGTARRAASTPVVVCITDTPEERGRLAEMFDGVGVLVIASDTASASRFLGTLNGTPTGGEGGSDSEPGVIVVEGLRVDMTHCEATWDGRPLHLTRHELKVLGCLATLPGRVWTYQQLHDHAWDGSYFTGPAAVQSAIKRLRAKLRQTGVPLRIDAARGLGFRLTKAPPA